MSFQVKKPLVTVAHFLWKLRLKISQKLFTCHSKASRERLKPARPIIILRANQICQFAGIEQKATVLVWLISRETKKCTTAEMSRWKNETLSYTIFPESTGKVWAKN